MEHIPLVQRRSPGQAQAPGTPRVPEPPRQVAPRQVAPRQVTPGPVTAGPVTAGPVIPGPVIPGPVTPGQGTSARRTPWLGIAAIAAAAFALEMAVSARYGYHRDELYFLAAGQHPAFGYVDQPSLTPLVARAEAVLFGNSLVGLRVLPALALSALALLTAAMSRILGAARAGQLIAALAAASCA